MKKNNRPVVFHARASGAGYIVFGLLYSPIIAIFLFILFSGKLRGQEYVAFLPWLLLISTYVWLLGFRITITDTTFEYRDGFWRSRSCRRDQISSAKLCWLQFDTFGRTVKLPRLVIKCRENIHAKIVINPKPFSREAMKRVREILGCEQELKCQNTHN
ncbi:MAG: hypothetical protein NZM03_13530 [Limisphaera sp.]|nr:hypothetical protein [Limisphaera sp.]